ncbi:suppressor of fused domain protein [Longimicrobium terrae]|uniref:Suppressor of fused-like domain-containing protein n=1 Tax=Longimicrobium terrae TaxID=1639882 RepID=A0A841GV58_9BACT|nr:suppressor of fused domain protein [Longimicrobium terrae]MBB4635084.1 hypothetical protein [Longimicrobium terrae]MBB6069478.1 hypothetical protein [Longimicrobium terrae]
MEENPEPLENEGIIKRYTSEPGPQPISSGDADLIGAITEHIERHLGPVEQVFHEIVSPTVHVDIHWVAPSRERPWHILVTSGMSERPMNAPEGMEGFRYAELLVSLPATWPLTVEAFEDEANYWPLRWLKILARFAHEYDTWLSFGHTMPNGNPPEPFAPSTQLCGMMLVPPAQAPDFFELDAGGGRTIHFWSLLPLHGDEVDLKLREGADALLDRFDKAGVGEVINPARPSVVPRGRWWRPGR